MPSDSQAHAILPKLDSGEEVESHGRKPSCSHISPFLMGVIIRSKMTRIVMNQPQIYWSKYGTAL